MSAICGVLRFDGAPVVSSVLARQVNSLKEWGPDRAHTWCGGPIGLGHAQLRVTAEDECDEQPLIDRAADMAAVGDLRLDNREELAALLDIDTQALRGLTDNALLLAAYKIWGEDCAEHLLGDFAFAIWDGRARKLVLGRDHMGQRYIFYHRAPNFFVFGSALKSLWAVPDVPRRLDKVRLLRTFIGDRGDLRGTAPYEEIFGVRGGSVLTVTADGAVNERRYWTPHPDSVHIGRDEAYYIETYRRLLTEAVQCRVRRTTRPAGLFFSGGFDSAAIAALAGPVLSAKGHKLIAAASVAPDDHPGHPNDSRANVEICRRAMPYLDVHYVTQGSFGLVERLEADFLQTNTCRSVNRGVNDAILKALKRGGARLVMDGHGGDYTINPTANGWLAGQLRRGRVWTFVSEFRALRRQSNTAYVTLLVYEVFRPLLPPRLRQWLDGLRKGLRRDPFPVPVTRAFARSIRAEGGVLRRTRPKPGRNDWRGRFLAMLLSLQDGMASAGYPFGVHGLEFTQPFHDKRIVEFALAVPDEMFFRGGWDRYLARKALAGLYPPEFETQRKGLDYRFPDFPAVAGRERPDLLAEIARLERHANLARIFDFGRMRSMLDLVARRSGPPLLDPSRAIVAVRTLILARFIEWTERDNRFEPGPDGAPVSDKSERPLAGTHHR